MLLIMELEQQKEALQKLLVALTNGMESKLKLATSTEASADSLLVIAQEYSQMLRNKQLLEEELSKVAKAATPTQMRRN